MQPLAHPPTHPSLAPLSTHLHLSHASIIVSLSVRAPALLAIRDLSCRSALLPLMSAGPFGEPTISGEKTDAAKYKKLAQRVQATLNTYCLNQGTPKKAKNLDPRLVLVSPKNRDGAPLNVPHVHQLLKDFKQHGFARDRPQTGICVEVTGAEKQALIEYNKNSQQGTGTSRSSRTPL